MIGGIDALVQYTENFSSVSFIVLILEIFNELQGIFDEEVLKNDVIMRLKSILMNIPNNINEDDIKNSKKEDFTKLLKAIEIFFRPIYRGLELNKIHGEFELSLLLM